MDWTDLSIFWHFAHDFTISAEVSLSGAGGNGFDGRAAIGGSL